MSISIDPLFLTRGSCLQEQKFLILMKFNLSVFYLMAHTFGIALRGF